MEKHKKYIKTDFSSLLMLCTGVRVKESHFIYAILNNREKMYLCVFIEKINILMKFIWGKNN